ncbi:MAG: hypothetical protein KC501_32515 [Myxococcales bacterium]|nr:hypothetical protein [Myxococcales bacterium]
MPAWTTRRARALALGLALAAVPAPSVAHACAPAPPLDQEVIIRGEEAVIVWDAKAGREHFIRRADFETEAQGPADGSR